MLGKNTLQHKQVQLTAVLKKSAGLLGDHDSKLKAEIIEACDRIHKPTYRVALFGPFNYGKSTLLNAILGDKTLPMDLVPTTGAPITIKYGTEPRTTIVHTDGSTHEETGTDAVKDYAVLNEQRQMHADVISVYVYCPHPLLKLGIELVDLPGTDDQQAQNDLVQKQLLSADLVIQLLDGRKLMTLAERENLRDWLLDRGINNVIFVVNFLNLMDMSDRQQVALRLRFLCESFRAQLPNDISSLYQVDALPALRARLQGNTAAAAESGLPALESALQAIGTQFSNGRTVEQSLPRLKVVATDVIKVLQRQIESFKTTESNPTSSRKAEIKTKAQALIQTGFDQSVTKLQNWLTLQNLQNHYRIGLSQVIENKAASAWLQQHLQPAWRGRQKPVVEWIHQACEILGRDCPADLSISFTTDEWPSTQRPSTGQNIDYAQQADAYLSRFSERALQAVHEYRKVGDRILQTPIPKVTDKPSPTQEAWLNLTKVTVEELTELIESL